MFPAINEELEPGNLSSQVFAQKDEANLLFLIEMKDSNILVAELRSWKFRYISMKVNKLKFVN